MDLTLDNRELAALIWLGIAVVLALFLKQARAVIVDVFRLAFQPFILRWLFLLFAYISLEIWLGIRVGLWNPGLIKPTIIWSLGSGVGLSFSAITSTGESRFFRRALTATFAVALAVEFFMNLFVMSFLAEFFLQPTVAILATLALVAGSDEEHHPVKIFCESLLALLGFTLLGFTLWQLYINWSSLDHSQLWREFFLPIWLTVGLVPFLYLLSLYMAYDSAWRHINRAASSARARWRARATLVRSFHLRNPELYRFARNWCIRLAEAPSYEAARDVVREFRQVERDVSQAAADERERLERYAGVDGTDADGLRLDRREFKETVNALRWLHACQMGWYRKPGSRYRTDLLEAIGDFAHLGLPKDHAIALNVAPDGQSWYAWRRTVTGWCFAIGAAGSPPDLWEFEGPELPDGFPGEDQAWGDAPFSSEANRNW